MYLIIVAPENLTDYGKIYLWSPLNPFLTNVPILPPPPPFPLPPKKTPLHLVIESTGDDVKLESLAKKKITA